VSDYRIALRDHNGRLDDVVVNDVSMFRAEMMDDTTLWMACYLPGTTERVSFWVRATRRKGQKMRLEFHVTEWPNDPAITYEDDEQRTLPSRRKGRA
jgi:hypothetical protein